MAESERLTQVERALMGLRSLIMSGELPAAARMPEVALSERLGISRTPLRQAMDRLVSEGLLERQSSGGCRVASFELEDIRDAIELRGVAEGTAARLAAERGADPTQLSIALGILDELDGVCADPDAIDLGTYARLNAWFHDVLTQLAGSAVIHREAQRIRRLPLATPSAFASDLSLIPDFLTTLSYAQRQHREIITAVENREGSRAEALAREHARLAQGNIALLLRSDPHIAKRVPGLSLLSGTK